MIETAFTSPQRQSPIGIVVLFFDTIQEYARALGPILLIFFLNFSDSDAITIAAVSISVFVFIAVIAYIKYRNFTFFLDNENEEFIVTEGVFNKTRTTIQLRKIQQVDIKQNLLQQIVGVHTLDVDTAGTNKQEIAIKAVTHNIAIALKARLLDNTIRRDFVNEHTDETADEKPLIKISFASLFKVGITSNYLRTFGVLLAFFASTYENFHRVSRSVDLNEEQFSQYFQRSILMESVALIVTAFLAMVLVLNLGRIVIRYLNYTITRQSGSLLLSFGLINTRNTIVKPEKVQIFSWSQNYFQKKLDVLELKIREATGGEQEDRKKAIEIPGCDEGERNAILKLLYGQIPQRGVMLKPNYRKLVFSIFLTIILPLICFYAIAANVKPRLFDFSYMIAAYVLSMLLILYFGFRNYRLFINDDFIIRQTGAWDIKNEVIEPHKIQALTTSQLFWHKGADIGYLTIHTAGGDISFQLGNFTVIKSYVNQWLYEMERTDSNWN